MGPGLHEQHVPDLNVLWLLPGPRPTPVLSVVGMLLFRGELGRLVF
jgi:hypothetical protein